MKITHLLPGRYKIIGWVLFVPAAVLCILYWVGVLSDVWCVKTFVVGGGLSTVWFRFLKEDLLLTLSMLLLALSLLFISFSKERDEDECIGRIRERSLVWALIANYILLMIAVIFLYDFVFLNFIVLNMYLILILFVIRFHVSVYKFRKSVKDE